MANPESKKNYYHSFRRIHRTKAIIAFFKFWSVVRTELQLVYRERIFLITLPLIVALNLVILPQLLPHVKTFTMIASSSTDLLKYVLVFYAIFPPVEAIMRDVSEKRGEIVFPAPISTANYLFAKFVASILHLLGLILLLLITNVLYGLAISASSFSLIPFFNQYLLILFPLGIFMTSLSFAFVVITKNRYVPYLCCITFFIASSYYLLKVERISNYIWLIDWFPRGYAYSSITGFGAYLLPIALNRAFYAGITLFLLLISTIMFNREGREGFIPKRIKPVSAAFLIGSIFLTILVGATIYSKTPRYYDPIAKARHKALIDSLSSRPIPKAKHCHLKIDLHPINRGMDAQAEILVRNKDSRPITELVLTLNEFAEIREIKIDGNTNDFQRAYEVVWVKLDQPITSGKESKIELVYRAWFPDRLARGRLNSCITSTHSYLLAESFWFPIVGLAKDFPFQLFTADVEIGIHADQAIALSNGRLVNIRTEGGSRYFHWKVEDPTFGLAVISGDYKKIKEENIELYLVNSKNPNAKELLKCIKKIISILENNFCKLPYPKVGIVEIPESRHGGHGDPSLISIGENMFLQDVEDYRLISFLAHEIAHQWWPGIVSCKEKGTGFLGEGLAEFSSLLVIEAMRGKEERSYKLRDWRYGYLNKREIEYEKSIAETKHSIEEDDPKVAANYGVVSYAKSPYVLNMLRYVMGDQAFFKAFQNYIDEYKFRGASIDDFVRVFTKGADSDLSWFFDEWIYGICLPDYAFENVAVREAGEMVIINGKVKNLGTGKMPVIIQAEGEGQQTRKTIWIDSEESADFELQTNFPPERLEIDPDKEILQWSTKNDIWDIAQLRPASYKN